MNGPAKRGSECVVITGAALAFISAAVTLRDHDFTGRIRIDEGLDIAPYDERSPSKQSFTGVPAHIVGKATRPLPAGRLTSGRTSTTTARR